MKKPEFVIMLGFILVTLGIVILALSGSSSEGGFVFVFPFFFIGNVDSIGIVPIIGFVLLITLFFILMFSSCRNFNHQAIITKEIPTYVEYDTICTLCGEAMPKTAKFCPACGHVQDKNNQLDDPQF